MTITKEQFQRYEEVRVSGVTNMFRRTVVQDLTNLSMDEISFIMDNYGALKAKYLC